MDAAVFGLIVADVIAQPIDLQNPPAPGGLTFLESLTLTTGGNVCNVATAMARLGASVGAAGMVGDDVFGRAMLDKLRAESIDTSAVFVSPKAQTSATVVAVQSDGQRTFFHTPGVTPLLDAAAFRRCFDLFRQCSWVQIGYFGLLPGLTSDLPDLLAELRQTAPNTKVALDTVNPPASLELLKPILPHLDLFAPSRTEAAALTGYKQPKKVVAFFASSCRRAHRHQARHRRLLPRRRPPCATVAGCKVDVVDTTGAGDTWFGALLVALRKEMPLEEAGRFANRAAADCCTALVPPQASNPSKTP